MRIPVVRGVIDRRILVNYRVDPEILVGILPKPFQPKLAHGAGMAGVGPIGKTDPVVSVRTAPPDTSGVLGTWLGARAAQLGTRVRARSEGRPGVMA
jgi:hypothetical protein